MKRILIASHGTLASGFVSSLGILTGDTSHIVAIDAYMDSSNFKEEVDCFFNTVNVDDEVIMLSDLYGGSVNQILYLYLERANTRLIAGVNLAFVLELAMKSNPISDKELQILIDQSKQMLREVKLDSTSSSHEEDFF